MAQMAVLVALAVFNLLETVSIVFGTFILKDLRERVMRLEGIYIPKGG